MTITREQIRELAEFQDEQCCALSFYFQPAAPSNKAHKEVTGVDADYWGSPFYYSMLQMLTQSIEAVGSMDRTAIAAHFRGRKFWLLDADSAPPTLSELPPRQ